MDIAYLAVHLVIELKIISVLLAVKVALLVILAIVLIVLNLFIYTMENVKFHANLNFILILREYAILVRLLIVICASVLINAYSVTTINFTN